MVVVVKPPEERDRVINNDDDDDGKSHPLGGVGNVFSHEWEVQTERTNRNSNNSNNRRTARDGGRLQQPKPRSIKEVVAGKSVQIIMVMYLVMMMIY